MITKYDLMMIEFDPDGKDHRATKQALLGFENGLARPTTSVQFMFIETDPPNVSKRETIKI